MLVELAVRDNQVFRTINGVADREGAKIEGTGPIAYALLVNRTSLLEFETFKFK